MRTEDMSFEHKAVVLWFVALGTSTGLMTGALFPHPVVFAIGAIGTLICYLILLGGIYLQWRDKNGE